MIAKCPECGIDYAVDENGKPFYSHDHTESDRNDVIQVKYVRDRWGNLIVDFEKIRAADLKKARERRYLAKS